jgi:hypothetical protein
MIFFRIGVVPAPRSNFVKSQWGFSLFPAYLTAGPSVNSNPLSGILSELALAVSSGESNARWREAIF